jgi:hypothetical protein
MSVRPSTHRSSGSPTAIRDLPTEVVRKAFVLLSPFDLAAARLVCRDWNVRAQDVLMSRTRVSHDTREKVVCGLFLRILAGFTNVTIKTLDLDVQQQGYGCIVDVVGYTAPSLSSLRLDLSGTSSAYCFYALKAVFDMCRGIRHLSLICFGFGVDVASRDETTLRSIKDGLGLLNRIDLIRCRGNVASFIQLAHIPNLETFCYESSRLCSSRESEVIIVAAAKKYPTLVSIRLNALFDSSSSILMAMKSCPGLKKMILRQRGGRLRLSHSDILSFRLLTSLDLDCPVPVQEGAEAALASCVNLKRLRVHNLDLSAFLPAIGSNLDNLEIGHVRDGMLYVIVQYCGNLRFLEIGEFARDEGWGFMLKSRLKKLAKLRLSHSTILLGTDC